MPESAPVLESESEPVPPGSVPVRGCVGAAGSRDAEVSGVVSSGSVRAGSERRVKTAVAWSGFGAVGRDIERRGSGAEGRAGAASPGSGTAGSFPDVDSVDDSYRFDLSGDVPATDASSRAPPVQGARAQPNRESSVRDPESVKSRRPGH
ncbi:hypothetical protein PV517_42390 [Streptomyces griseiscabiei]|uniref:Uncharacterized protein n=1 Tax=Streptomyces griseiscabiei TaxID=2993540 RepID=A0ABU4LHN8_9ACTN|nr:hypothetical protein [Streptomyces griseiscabiei]MDX2915306.1 hypothetical protein [Streptomyces griseiscabiei]